MIQERDLIFANMSTNVVVNLYLREGTIKGTKLG